MSEKSPNQESYERKKAEQVQRIADKLRARAEAANVQQSVDPVSGVTFDLASNSQLHSRSESGQTYVMESKDGDGGVTLQKYGSKGDFIEVTAKLQKDSVDPEEKPSLTGVYETGAQVSHELDEGQRVAASAQILGHMRGKLAEHEIAQKEIRAQVDNDVEQLIRTK